MELGNAALKCTIENKKLVILKQKPFSVRCQEKFHLLLKTQFSISLLKNVI